MKKKNMFLLFLLITLSVGGFASSKDFEISTYISNKNPIGNLSEYSSSYIGSGTSVTYTIPNFPFISFTGRAEAESVISKNQNHHNWWGFTFTGGVLANLSVSESIKICPELSYGVILNTLSIDGQKTLFTDQIMQVAASIKFAPKTIAERKMSFDIAPLYTIAFEKNTTVNYLGVRAGVNYLFK